MTEDKRMTRRERVEDVLVRSVKPRLGADAKMLVNQPNARIHIVVVSEAFLKH